MTWEWTLSPENRQQSASGQHDNGVWESAKTDTLSYTVAHSSFEMKREQSHKQVAKSVPPSWLYLQVPELLLNGIHARLNQ
jgi:hypothetical protein